VRLGGTTFQADGLVLVVDAQGRRIDASRIAGLDATALAGLLNGETVLDGRDQLRLAEGRVKLVAEGGEAWVAHLQDSLDLSQRRDLVRGKAIGLPDMIDGIPVTRWYKTNVAPHLVDQTWVERDAVDLVEDGVVVRRELVELFDANQLDTLLAGEAVTIGGDGWSGDLAEPQTYRAMDARIDRQAYRWFVFEREWLEPAVVGLVKDLAEHLPGLLSSDERMQEDARKRLASRIEELAKAMPWLRQLKPEAGSRPYAMLSALEGLLPGLHRRDGAFVLEWTPDGVVQQLAQLATTSEPFRRLTNLYSFYVEDTYRRETHLNPVLEALERRRLYGEDLPIQFFSMAQLALSTLKRLYRPGLDIDHSDLVVDVRDARILLAFLEDPKLIEETLREEGKTISVNFTDIRVMVRLEAGCQKKSSSNDPETTQVIASCQTRMSDVNDRNIPCWLPVQIELLIDGETHDYVFTEKAQGQFRIEMITEA
jgi:hypothetical protein